MRLDRFIASQLCYSAGHVRVLLARRQVRVNGQLATSGDSLITEFCLLEVAGQIIQNRQPLYFMLNKPPGCVSATQDKKSPTVIDLIEHPLKSQLHLAGRLDFNTTGLILLTNNGRWSRGITEPQAKVSKTYWVATHDEITQAYVEAFAEGFYFAYENLHTAPAHLRLLTCRSAILQIYEGRYHQIKRMFGRFNNEVVGLHRLAIGGLSLDSTLGDGAYRALTPEEIALFC